MVKSWQKRGERFVGRHVPFPEFQPPSEVVAPEGRRSSEEQQLEQGDVVEVIDLSTDGSDSEVEEIEVVNAANTMQDTPGPSWYQMVEEELAEERARIEEEARKNSEQNNAGGDGIQEEPMEIEIAAPMATTVMAVTRTVIATISDDPRLPWFGPESVVDIAVQSIKVTGASLRAPQRLRRPLCPTVYS